MDAVKLLKEAQRMCIETECCEECPICEYCAIDTDVFEVQEPEKVVKIIEKWANEHPVKTRQSEFLKMFPNAKLEKGVIRICPQHIEGEDNYACVISAGLPSCTGCRKKYWLTEVE